MNGLAGIAGMMTGMPSFSGGDSGPAFSEASSSGYLVFNNPFSVSGQGGAATTAQSQGVSTTTLLFAAAGLAAVILLR